MQVLITRTTVANRQFVREGTVQDLPDSEARSLIALGKAEEITASVEAEAKVETEAETHNVAADEAPRRGKRSKKD